MRSCSDWCWTSGRAGYRSRRAPRNGFARVEPPRQVPGSAGHGCLHSSLSTAGSLTPAYRTLGRADSALGEFSHPIVTAALSKAHRRFRMEVPRNRRVQEEPGVGRQLLQDAFDAGDDELVAALFDAEENLPGCIDMHNTLDDVRELGALFQSNARLTRVCCRCPGCARLRSPHSSRFARRGS